MEVESTFDWTACEPLGMGNRVVSVNVFVGNDKNLYSIAILIQNDDDDDDDDDDMRGAF